MAEEIDVDRDAEHGQAEAPRMMGKLEIEQPPRAAEIAADAGIHEAGEQRHAADPEEIRLRVNPGAGLRLEDLHRRSDDMIDQDHLCLVRCLQFPCEQRDLNRDHAEKQKIVARKPRCRRIEPPGRDHQENGDPAEQAGPALLHAEAEKFVKRRCPAAARHEAAEPIFARDEGAQRRPDGGGARLGFGGVGLAVRGAKHAIDGGGGTRCKIGKYLQIPLSPCAVLAHRYFALTTPPDRRKAAHGQETRDQSQRRICLFQCRL